MFAIFGQMCRLGGRSGIRSWDKNRIKIVAFLDAEIKIVKHSSKYLNTRGTKSVPLLSLKLPLSY